MNSIVLFGYSNAARHLAEQLRQQGLAFTVVERDNAHLNDARDAGFDTVLADFTNDETLGELGIGTTVRQLFCMLPEDSENLFLTLSARALDPDITIISACESGDAASKLKIAGANKVVDLYSTTAHRVHDLLTKPLVVDVLDRTLFGQADLHMAEIVIPEGLDNTRLSLQKLNLSGEFDLVLIGIVDHERSSDFHFVGAGIEHLIDPGDILVVIGRTADIERLHQHLDTPSPVT
ncbi:MAG: NAD-binding protein [Gammaproteobacteria bacterium]|nr:NAD-binding protein [Gammaproteobacteria bacterium]